MTVRVLDRETGQILTLRNEDAEEGIRAGRYAVSSRSPIEVTNERSEALEVDAANLGAALEGGLRLDTQQDAAVRQDRRLEEQYGSGGAAVRAFAEGVGREATFGVSDPILELLGVSSQEGLAQRRERNPNAAMAGEITGAVAPMLLSGGTSTAARGATGAARSALRLGGAIPRTIGTGADMLAGAGTRALMGQSPGIARRIAARAGGMALGGAFEGAADGVRQILTEDALGDAPVTAERVLAGAGWGALFGTATGGLLGGGTSLIGEGLRGAGRGAQRLMGGSADAIRNAYESATGRGLSGGAAELYARVSSLASGADESAIARLTGLSDEGRRARDLIRRRSEVLDDGTRRITEALTDIERASTHTQDFAVGSLKRDPIVRAVRTDTVGAQMQAAQEALAEARRIADDITSNPHVYSGRGGVAQGRNLSRAMDGIAGDMAAAVERAAREPAEGAADLFISLDRFKRFVGRLQNRTSDPEAQAVLRRLYDGPRPGEGGWGGIRRILEDENLWGGTVTRLQRETNQAWTGFLGRRRQYSRRFLSEGARDTTDGAAAGALVDPFRSLYQGDSRRVAGFVNGFGTAANEGDERLLRETLEAQAELNERILEHFDVPPEVREQAIAARAQLQAIRETLDEVGESARTINQFRELAGDGGAARSVIALAAGGALGTALGDGEGAAIGGTIATALANPGQAVRVLTALDRLAGQSTQRIGDSVRRFLRRGGRAGRGAGARAGNLARRTAVVATVSAYREKISELSELSNPRTLQERIAQNTRDLDADAPHVQQALQTTAVRAASYLRERMPPQQRHAEARLIPGDRDRPPSRTQIREFMRVVRAVEDPLSLMDDLEARRINRASVDAVRAVYPELYSQIVGEVLSELREMETEPPYRDRLQLGTLLGAPTDPSLRPEFIASMQQASAAQRGGAPAQAQPTSPAPGQAPDVASQMASETRRLEARG